MAWARTKARVVVVVGVDVDAVMLRLMCRQDLSRNGGQIFCSGAACCDSPRLDSPSMRCLAGNPSGKSKLMGSKSQNFFMEGNAAEEDCDESAAPLTIL